jgi:hypothetical protein
VAQGLTGKKSRMKCYISVPSRIEEFFDKRIKVRMSALLTFRSACIFPLSFERACAQVLQIASSRRHMVAIGLPGELEVDDDGYDAKGADQSDYEDDGDEDEPHEDRGSESDAQKSGGKSVRIWR